MTWLRLLIGSIAVLIVASCAASSTIGPTESAAAEPVTEPVVSIEPTAEPAPEVIASVEDATPLTEDQIVEAWCTDQAPAIQAALKRTIIVHFGDPDSLAEAVEALHLLYRQSPPFAPTEIQPMVDEVNRSLDELEPIMRPIAWDYDQIDRSFVAGIDRSYADSGSAIDFYNAETCGLAVAGMLPTEAEMAAFENE